MEDKKIKLGIIGHFANGKIMADGQTVKTIALYDALKNNYSDDFEIEKVDTWFVKRKPLYFFFKLWVCMFKSSRIIVIVSNNGRRILFPILYLGTKILHVKVFHYAIGGRLADEITDHPLYKKYVAAFSGNWMESKSQVQRLRGMGVLNAEYIPNFKKLVLSSEDTEIEKVLEEYSLNCCTFSRVMREKGISDAIDAIVELNKRYGKDVVKLDIYGSVHPDYMNEFESKVQINRTFIEYKGVIAPDQSTAVISHYDLLLFPTHYNREGIPGTIIDAFASGVPALAREWQYGKEMIVHGENGFLYPHNNPEQLVDWIDYCLNNKDLLKAMRSRCLESAKDYSEEFVLPQIKTRLESL